MADKLYGWKGKMLWIDLAAKTGKDLDISDLCEKYIGGRGIASKLAWDYIKPGTGAFDDGNLLMFMNGPVAGSLLPGAGRGYVFAVAPQSYPEHFSRSSIGGRWATELKACGYDGIILANKADDKTVLEINDNGVVFHDGNPYWGQDTHVTQEKLKEQFGEDMDAVCIGQAGERLIRIATVQTLVNNAAGQGGFGAVMGDKKVKAIVFKGTQPTYVADMAKVDQLRREIFSTAFGYTEGGSLADQPADIGLIPGNMFKADQLIAEGSMTSVNNKYAACRGCGLGGYSCVSGYAGQWSYKDVPAVHDKRTMSGAYKCAEQVALGWVTETTDLDRQWVKTGTGRKYRWPANFRAGVEIIDMWNRYGLNGWELGSMMIWLSELDSIGVDLPALTGMDDFDMSDPTIFQRCLIKLVEREPGFFYDLGEGLARIGTKLGDGYREYTTHALNGYCDHALGTRCYYNHTYPTWVAPALMWATDNRDPFSDVGHRYYEISFTFKRKDLAKKLWGDELTIGPDENLRSINGGDMEDDVFDDLAYSMKEYPAVQCQNRGVVTGSGIFCDGVYPNYGAKIFDGREGDFDLEAKVLTAVTGVEYTTEGLEKFGDRIVNMERCYNILEWGRNKEYDMLICDNIQPRGDWSTGKRIDKERFSKLLGRFYALRGWDEDGIPSEAKLLDLGLEECNEMMKPFRK